MQIIISVLQLSSLSSKSKDILNSLFCFIYVKKRKIIYAEYPCV